MIINDHMDFSARYEVLRSGGTFARLYPADTPELVCSSSSELKMSIKGRFYSPDADVDFLTDRLRVVVTINGAEYPCGLFYVTSETTERDAGNKLVTLEGYSPLYAAKRAKLESRLHIPAGTNYITKIRALLISAGLTDITSQSTLLSFATDREDWEIGTDVLTVVNALLGEINYNTAWVDLSGGVRLTKYAAPSAASIAHTYAEGKYSLVTGDWKRSDDTHGKCNVFKVICSNPDLGAPMSATAVNSDPACRFSTANIGRVLHVETVDNAPSQSALQERADNLAAKSLLSTETVEFYTMIDPTHTAFETVALSSGGLTGIFAETEWRMPLSASENMTHKAKRIMT